MKIIAQKPFSNIRILGGTVSDYKLRYSQMADALKGSKSYALFAEPMVTGANIAWTTNQPGTILSYSLMSSAEKSEVDKLLRTQASRLIAELADNVKVADLVKQYLTVPSEDDIFVSENNGVKTVILTQWGSVSDNADKKPLQIIADERFPVPVIIVVKFTDGNPATGEEVFMEFNNREHKETTDSDAKIDFGKLNTGTNFAVYQYVEGKRMFVHNFTTDIRIEYLVQIPRPQNMRFKVQDTNGVVQQGMPFVFDFSDTSKELISSTDGIMELPGIKVGTSVSCSHPKDGGKLYPHKYVCEVEKEFYIITIPAPVQEIVPQPVIATPEPEIVPITVKLIDHKNRPVPEKVITLKHHQDTTSQTTDNHGIIPMSVNEPMSGDKIFAEVKLSKRKTKKRELVFKPEQSEYIIKLKKCRWCWLLLLLLLPLLLLIPLKKDVTFKVINSYNNEVVSSLDLNFEYTKRDAFNFDSLKFFTRYYPYPNPAFTEQTDSNGIAVFKNVRYTVYQWLFKKNDTCRAFALSDCYNLDTTLNFFQLKEVNTVYMNPVLLDLDFTVVDADDSNEPINEALVTIEADMFSYKDSALSNADGHVSFKRIPLCANVYVNGSRFGYTPETIRDKTRNIYHEKDTLSLHQISKPVVFFIKDSKSKKGIPDALGTLYLKKKGKITPPVKTNASGKGKIFRGEGTFPSVFIAEELKIYASKSPYYKDSTTLDFEVPKFYPVEPWINTYTEEQRTVYLRPLERPILFQNIDADTNRGIAGVENTVTIVHSDGKTEILPPILSDRDGNFGFSAIVGDKINIVAKTDQCPPRYEANDYSIKNAEFGELEKNADLRKIPLKRAPAPAVRFQNTNLATGAPLAGVNNVVSADGAVVGTYTSDAGGWFTVDKVYDCQKISITASKSGFSINDKTIQNRPLEVLIPAAASERVIPLQEDSPPPPNVIKCESVGSGGAGVTTTVHDLEGCNQFTIMWDMYTKPDKLTVYCGHGATKKFLYTTGVPVNYEGSKFLTCKDRYITVVIEGIDPETEWNYRLNCECN